MGLFNRITHVSIIGTNTIVALENYKIKEIGKFSIRKNDE
jgi:hypothetical protein